MCRHRVRRWQHLGAFGDTWGEQGGGRSGLAVWDREKVQRDIRMGNKVGSQWSLCSCLGGLEVQVHCRACLRPQIQ